MVERITMVIWTLSIFNIIYTTQICVEPRNNTWNYFQSVLGNPCVMYRFNYVGQKFLSYTICILGTTSGAGVCFQGTTRLA